MQGHIAEGLYVEYKSAFPLAVKVAHSVASFANTHGGWYIVGIKTDENNEPQSIEGFDLALNPNPKEWLRDVIKSNVDPVPHVESKLVRLSTGKVVLVAYVPESLETPHITRDGRIYRRNAEGSDPVPEINRYVVDQLYERGKRFKEYLRRFCRSEFAYSKAQEKQGWFLAYIIPYPLGSFEAPDFTKQKLDELRKHFAGTSTFFGILSMGIPFQIMQNSLDSVTLRQTKREQLAYLTLTVRIFRNGAAKFLVPLQYVDPLAPRSEYASSAAFQELVSHLSRSETQLFRIIDGYGLFTAFMVLTAKHIEFLRKSDWAESNLLVAYELQETWRHIMFFDSEEFTEQLQTHGVPVCHESRGRIPATLEKDPMMITLDERMESLAGDFRLVSDYFGIFRETFLGCIRRGWVDYLRRIQEAQPAID